MGRKRVRVQSVCLGRAPACSRICSLFFRTKPTSDSNIEGFKAGSEIGNKIMVVVDSSLEAKGALEWALSNTIQTQDTIILLHIAKPSRRGEITFFFCHDDPAVGFKAGSEIGNKIMVVVDSSLEAKGALEWALSNTIQTQDTIILLHIAKPFRRGPNGKGNLRAYEFLHSMKNTCQTRRPGVQVEISLLEGKEKGPIIVEEAKQQRVSLLVIGQRKKSSRLDIR
ncbi:hypothetical protein CFP56_019296 [Quercus suber]|uniref:UspA domain-containing protein n=1 Tax=Quercus suber TaxID=58331 RepID=A0AAW0KIM9_QUESU